MECLIMMRQGIIKSALSGKYGNVWHQRPERFLSSMMNFSGHSPRFNTNSDSRNSSEKNLMTVNNSKTFPFGKSVHFFRPRSTSLLNPNCNISVSCNQLHTSAHRSSSFQLAPHSEDKYLSITGGKSVLKIPYIWLRDHCRSEACYNHETQQKIPDFDLVGKDLVPSSVKIVGDEGIKINWKDGHVSEFSFKWLINNFYPGQFSEKQPKLLWDRNMILSEGLPSVSYDDYMNKDEGLKKSLSNLVKFGFTLVDGTEASVEGTQAVVERISFVQETLFGGMWSFTANNNRSDTAYSQQYLGPHTDSTYSDTPSGIQVFQCLEHSGSGGETLLVDGFHAAERLRSSCPPAFELLNKTTVPHEYKEKTGPNTPGYHLYSLGQVITTHPASGEMLHLRFNPYDRAPLNTVAPDDIPAFYEAYSKLTEVVNHSDNHLWHKLKPGTVLFIDNWRVMHGRAAFEGKRVMCGCYLPREQWVSKARVMGAM